MTTPVSDLMRMIQIKMINRGDAWSRELPLTVTQSRTIGWIDYIEETEHRGVIQRELAEMSGTSAASISSLIDGLEKGGYVERRPSTDDARRKEIYVLPKAKGMTDGFQKLMDQTEKDLLEPLTAAERTQLLALLTKVNDHLDPDLPLRRPQN